MYLNNKEPESIQECIDRLKSGTEILKNEYEYKGTFAKFNPPAKEADIKEYEDRLGFRLPQDYREFLLISDGAIIDYDHIFGLDDIGMNDDYVPEGYLAITSTELTTDRFAFSEEDGSLYDFFDLNAITLDFKDYLFGLLTTCEEEIIERKEKRRLAARTPEEIKRDKEKSDAIAAKWMKFFEEIEKNKK